MIIYFLGLWGSYLIGRRYFGNLRKPSLEYNSWVTLKILTEHSNPSKPKNFIEWQAPGNISVAPQYNSIAVYQAEDTAFSICEVDIYGFCEYQIQLVIVCGPFLA